MSAPPRLYAAVTPHGFGHLSMTGAVLSILRVRRPDIAVTVETTLPEAVVRSRIPGPLTLVPETEDFGLAMISATTLNREASAARYRTLHADWDGAVDRAARRMADHRPDIVFSNVGYITLAAARRLGIPALALGPFTWAHIYRHYFADRPEASGILATMEDAYRGARAVLAAEGAMPMDDLRNRHPIGPLGTPGTARPDALRDALGAPPGTRLALVTFGGVANGMDLLSRWPRDSGWLWLVRGGVAPDHPDARDTEPLTDWTFPDLLASCDAVVTKLGYGMAMECGFAQRPTLCWPRTDDWPEEPFLKAWLERHTPFRPTTPDRLRAGDVLDDLSDLIARPPPGPAPQATGANDAASIILETLDEG